MKKKVWENGNYGQRVYITNLMFADDQVIIAQDKENIKYILSKVIESYEKQGLRQNILEEIPIENDIASVVRFKYPDLSLIEKALPQTSLNEKQNKEGRPLRC